MKEIKVLGSGCANCKATAKLIEKVAAEQGVNVRIQKVEDFAEIAGYGVMTTPGVVVDGKVVHAGGIPDREAIAAWLGGQAGGSGCCSGNGASTGGGCCG